MKEPESARTELKRTQQRIQQITQPEIGEAKPERLQEPWLRGTLAGVPPIERAVLHSIEMAREDVTKWCSGLTELEMHTWPSQLASPAFHLLHIVGSLDRLLTYGEGRMLSPAQMQALAAEKDAGASKEEVFREFALGLEAAERRLRPDSGRPLDTPVKIGRKGLTTTLGGLLVHLAEHTQRHVGQAITTAKLLVAQRRTAVDVSSVRDGVE